MVSTDPTSSSRVARLPHAEAPRASVLPAESLHEDPGWCHAVPDASRRRMVLRTLLGISVRDALPFGHVLGAWEGRALAGVAVWLPPGHARMVGLRMARAVMGMSTLVVRAPTSLPGLARLGAGVARALADVPFWYLVALGVRSTHRGTGLGTRLMEPVLREADADADGVSCYLETGRRENIAYYERQAFSALGEVVPLSAGGAPMARMLRPPR